MVTRIKKKNKRANRITAMLIAVIMLVTMLPGGIILPLTAMAAPDAGNWDHTVTFLPGTNGSFTNPADPNITQNNIPYGEHIAAPPDITSQGGWYFIGWSDGGGIYSNAELTTEYRVIHDTVFTAQYTRNGQATVVFSYAGGTDGRGNSFLVLTGSPSSSYEDPYLTSGITKEGYDWNGWDNQPTLIFENSGSITTYKAQWTQTTHTVSFYQGSHGVLIPNPITLQVLPGSPAGDPPIPAIDAGYALIGWQSPTLGFHDSTALSILPVQSDVSFIAVYITTSSEMATVVFDYEGGKDGGWNSFSLLQDYSGSILTPPDSITRQGYQFNGWSLIGPDNGTVFDGTNPGTFGENGTITTYAAQWTPNSYTVTFLAGANGAMTPATAAESVEYGGAITNVPSITANTGYTFIGWSYGAGLYNDAAVLSYTVTKAITFTAQYTDSANATVVFDYNGGIDTNNLTSSSVTGKPGTAYIVPTVSKLGYSLDQTNPWTTADASNILGVFGGPNSNITYKANWVAATYTATFNDYDGRILGAITDLIYGQKISQGIGNIPSEPARPGYLFAGWSDGVSTYASSTVANYTVNGNVTLTAQYVKTFDAAVTFDYNGGTDRITYLSSMTVSGLPDTAYVIPAPVKVGYVLNGWTLNGVSAQPSGSFGAAGTDETYIAQWTPMNYTVTFAAGENGVMTPDPSSSQAIHGGSIGSVPNVTPNQGYDFIGWSDGTGIYQTDDLLIKPIYGDATFTAKYKTIEKATVIFNYAHGTDIYGNGYSVAQGYPGVMVATPTDLAKTGYTFNGWAPALEDFFGDAGSLITYTAQWTPVNYTVIFEQGENGVLTPNPTVTDTAYGKAVSAVPNITSNTGYAFLGWSDGEKVYGSNAMESYIVTENVTFTAQYLTIDKIAVTFNYNGGTDASGNSYVILQGFPGESLTAPTPTKIGYVFAGWDIVPPSTFDSPGTYTAKWTPNSYTVTFLAGANGAMNPATATESVEYGGTVTSVPNITANSDYIFLGWSMNGTGAYYSSEKIKNLPITEDTTFTAAYQKTTTVIIGGGGGGSSYTEAKLTVQGIDKYGKVIYSQTITVIVGLTETVNAPVIEGYILNADSPSAQTIQIQSGSNQVTFNYTAIEQPPEPTNPPEPINPPEPTNPPVSDKLSSILETVDYIKYLNGDPNGNVRPDHDITRAEVAALFFRLIKDPAKNSVIDSTFDDVNSKEWYAQKINYLAKIGILKGYPDGTFKPEQPITRAEFAAMASRFDDLVKTNGQTFRDVHPYHWAAKYIESGAAKGWINGYPDGSFRPENNITRAEAVKIINAMLNRTVSHDKIPANIPQYKDLDKSHWAYADIIEASVAHQYEKQADE